MKTLRKELVSPSMWTFGVSECLEPWRRPTPSEVPALHGLQERFGIVARDTEIPQSVATVWPFASIL